MKHIKKCKGFEGITCCSICKRKDYDCKETIVKKLSIDPDSGQERCIHHVYNKSAINRPNKFN